MRSKQRRALVLGLDCATSRFAFDRAQGRMPNLRRLQRRGKWGLLESCIPAITCPAWVCMSTSRDPGQLGIYGFRNRVSHNYGPLAVPDSGAVHAPSAWDVASRHGRRSLVLGVPLTYPPKPIEGWMVTGFLTPGTETDYTYPSEVREIIREEVPNYCIDVSDFRTEDKDALIDRIYRVTREHFALLEHMVRTKPWDLAWFVDLGIDRIQHAFWRCCSPDHPDYDPDGPYADVVPRYYQYVDGCIGRVRALLPDDTVILIASDHGARTLQGVVRINEWLIREGLLVLRDRPTTPLPLSPEMVDWSRTRVWAEGGYYARIMLNLHGREPEGLVTRDEHEPLLQRLTTQLEALRDPEGRRMGNRAMRPDRIYREVRGIPPDLLVYLEDLAWRAAGAVGHEEIHGLANDTGPDDANHAQHGIFVLYDPADPTPEECEGVTLYDIAPTLLDRMGLPPEAGMIGRPIPQTIGALGRPA